ncbi:MAG: hypothetical protein WAW42_06925 [Candidatus Competibacteraceae bacterium]
MTPSAIQDAIVATLAARYPTFTVEPHGGAFADQELPLLLSQAPALWLSCTRLTGLRVYRPARSWEATLHWSLLLLVKGSATVEREDQALDTVFDLLTWLPHQNWGLASAQLPPEDTLTAANLYTGQVNLLRVAAWGVTWQQTFETLSQF